MGERSETHRCRRRHKLMGLPALHPSYDGGESQRHRGLVQGLTGASERFHRLAAGMRLDAETPDRLAHRLSFMRQ